MSEFRRIWGVAFVFKRHVMKKTRDDDEERERERKGCNTKENTNTGADFSERNFRVIRENKFVKRRRLDDSAGEKNLINFLSGSNRAPRKK